MEYCYVNTVVSFLFVKTSANTFNLMILLSLNGISIYYFLVGMKDTYVIFAYAFRNSKFK